MSSLTTTTSCSELAVPSSAWRCSGEAVADPAVTGSLGCPVVRERSSTAIVPQVAPVSEQAESTRRLRASGTRKELVRRRAARNSSTVVSSSGWATRWLLVDPRASRCTA